MAGAIAIGDASAAAAAREAIENRENLSSLLTEDVTAAGITAALMA